MSVLTETRSVTYAGNGSTTDFPVPFSFTLDSDLVVTVNGEAVLQGDDYEIEDHDALEVSGNVVFDSAPELGDVVVFERVVPFTQTADLVTNGNHDPATIEERIDAATHQTQQLNERLEEIETVESEWVPLDDYFTNNWAAHADPDEGGPPSYRVSSDGRSVELRGVLRRSTGSASSGETVLTVPVAIRPTYKRHDRSTSGLSVVELAMLTTGALVVYEGIASGTIDETNLVLDGFKWDLGVDEDLWVPLTSLFENNWAAHADPAEAGPPSLRRSSDGRSVQLRGALRRTSGTAVSGETILTVPESLWPTYKRHGRSTSGLNVIELAMLPTGELVVYEGIASGTITESNLIIDGFEWDLT